MVEPLGFEGVVDEIAAHRVGVGQLGRRLNFRQLLAGADSLAGFVTAVWFVAAVPEAERSPRLTGDQEVAEVGGVVDIADVGAIGWCQAACVVFTASGIVCNREQDVGVLIGAGAIHGSALHR